jgi:phenylacetate-CoA ligase
MYPRVMEQRRHHPASLNRVRSSIGGMAWPAVPAAGAANLLALQFQLEQTQWWAPERLRDSQLRQLSLLLAHAVESVPFYRDRLGAAGFRAGKAVRDDWFTELPSLSRAEVYAQGDTLHSRSVPAAHGRVSRGQTSGSTGTPIQFLATDLTQLFWQAFNLRDHLWHRRDLSLRLATIRPDRGDRNPQGISLPHWGPAVALVFENGPSGILHSTHTLDRQIEWVVEQDPDYLLTLASNLLELAREMRRRNIRLPRLREARTFGDALRPQARAECATLLGVRVVDMYTAQEAGYLALECPESGHYHVQAESAIVEVVDDRGRACPPGAVGKVLVTTLHNFAMPLIRYEIGDYAEAGASCPCGRGLPVIRRVLGRERNIAVTPNGNKYYPSFAAEVWSQIAPIRQLQLVQKTPRHIEVRIASARSIGADEESKLGAALKQSLGHPYEFTFVYLESIPRAASGKYEDFVCEIGAGSA